MRYEDMLADPKSSFAGLARHLQLHATEARLALAVNRSSFDQLRDQEERGGFAERPNQADRFFREGRVGQWRDVLSAQQVERVVAAHREQMARFGYWPLD